MTGNPVPDDERLVANLTVGELRKIVREEMRALFWDRSSLVVGRAPIAG